MRTKIVEHFVHGNLVRKSIVVSDRYPVSETTRPLKVGLFSKLPQLDIPSNILTDNLRGKAQQSAGKAQRRKTRIDYSARILAALKADRK